MVAEQKERKIYKESVNIREIISTNVYSNVRPLPMPELPVKSDGIYRATLWLRNPGSSCRLHN